MKKADELLSEITGCIQKSVSEIGVEEVSKKLEIDPVIMEFYLRHSDEMSLRMLCDLAAVLLEIHDERDFQE